MASFKVNSLVSSYNYTTSTSTVVVQAVGHTFKDNDFVTISRCDVPELNGTFRVLSVSSEYFTFSIPLGPLAVSTYDGIYVSSLQELTIQPHLFSDTETSMAYLYGVSDFWSTIFEGKETIDLLLEAETLQAADVYNRFLQLASTLSLSEIQTTINSEIKLVVLTTDNLVPGTTNTYYLPEVILDASFVMNRPFLPTLTLEKGTHFDISEDGTEITLFEKLESLNFPMRKNADEKNEFALWLTDVKVDEQLISRYYGKLLAVTPQTSSDNFKNFVYGLFYLYSKGPNLALFRKGLNIALGLPLARDYETVLDVRQYLETNQYVVITDYNQYVIPYGITPTVAEGDYLIPSQELAQWVEIKDWINDGTWWYNLYIPERLIPFLPDGQVDRYARPGSYADQLMASYLKTHTFLVNVNVTSFKDIQTFQELYDIIYRAKPTYTTPIYIWSVPLDEILPLVDNLEDLLIQAEWCENLSLPISRMFRNQSNPALYLYRGCPQFIRFNASSYVAEITGGSSLINGSSRELNGGVVTGYINYRYQYEASDQTYSDKAWMRAIFTRDNWIQRFKKSMVKFNAGDTYVDNSGKGVKNFPVNIDSSYRIIPLYILSTKDLQDKLDTLGLTSITVTPNKWYIELYKPTRSTPYINQKAVNDGRSIEYSASIKANFNTLFTFTASSTPGNCIPRQALSYRFTGATSSDISTNDYILAVRIYDYAWGLYWITTNATISAAPYAEIHDYDSLTLSITGSKISRGMGPLGNPYYLLRGAGFTTTNDSKIAVNAKAVDGKNSTYSPTSPRYEDSLNTIQVMDRSGKLINIRKDLL